jgi:plastocyanin
MNKQTILQLFKDYPAVDEFHCTSDDQAFDNKAQAEAHQKTLKEGSVKTITRAEAEAEEAPKTVKHIVTEEDLVSNPALAEQGVKVGDEIEIPAPEEKKKKVKK